MEVEIPVPEGDGKIPPLTPLTNQAEEAPEIKPFKISFDDKYYKGSECQAHGMSKENGSCVLKIIRDVGVFFVDKANFLSKTLAGTEIIYVNNNNRHYANLYKGLELDEAVYEIKYVKEHKNIDFRLFFTLNERERIFHVVAIRQAHYDTTK